MRRRGEACAWAVSSSNNVISIFILRNFHNPNPTRSPILRYIITFAILLGRPSRRESALTGLMTTPAPHHHAFPPRSAGRKARQNLIYNAQEGTPRFPSQASSEALHFPSQATSRKPTNQAGPYSCEDAARPAPAPRVHPIMLYLFSCFT